MPGHKGDTLTALGGVECRPWRRYLNRRDVSEFGVCSGIRRPDELSRLCGLLSSSGWGSRDDPNGGSCNRGKDKKHEQNRALTTHKVLPDLVSRILTLGYG